LASPSSSENTVGSGILRTPGEIAARLQSSALVIAVWVLEGVYAFFCTLSVTELGTMLPRASGWYVYSRRAFGEYGGFVVGCCDRLHHLVKDRRDPRVLMFVGAKHLEPCFQRISFPALLTKGQYAVASVNLYEEAGWGHSWVQGWRHPVTPQLGGTTYDVARPPGRISASALRYKT
jgi:hypothetical protein